MGRRRLLGRAFGALGCGALKGSVKFIIRNVKEESRGLRERRLGSFRLPLGAFTKQQAGRHPGDVHLNEKGIKTYQKDCLDPSFNHLVQIKIFNNELDHCRGEPLLC